VIFLEVLRLKIKSIKFFEILNKPTSTNLAPALAGKENPDLQILSLVLMCLRHEIVMGTKELLQ
jgi:hypothetical protein